MISNALYATQPTTTMATTTATTDNTTYSQKIRDAFQLLTENNYVVYQEPKWKGQGKCDWCQYEHVLQEYMDFNDETGLYEVATDLCEGCVQDRNKFAKQEYEEAFAELKALKAEIEEWKQADKKREQSKARKARKPKTETLNFDDANYEFYWAAQNGDVVFWKVPCELMDLEDESGGSRVVEAFQGCRFGEEWGSLSSHGIRTMDLKVLEENE